MAAYFQVHRQICGLAPITGSLMHGDWLTPTIARSALKYGLMISLSFPLRPHEAIVVVALVRLRAYYKRCELLERSYVY